MSWFQTDLDFKGLNEERQKQLQIAPLTKAKKNEGANVLKGLMRLCNEFGFTAGMPKGSLAEGRKKQWALLTQ